MIKRDGLQQMRNFERDLKQLRAMKKSINK